MANRLTIRVENSWSYVDRDSPKDSLKWLHKLLAVKLESMANGEYTTWERYLFSLRSYKFPSGMVPFIIENAKKKLIDIDWDWKRNPPDGDVTIEDLSDKFDYLDQHQIEAFEVMKTHPFGILKHSTGSGKCLGPNTPIVMYDGSIKLAMNIKVGDRLMGPDSLPRTVLSTNADYGNMYKIIPNRGDSWYCNEDHILTLIRTKLRNHPKVPSEADHNRITDISVKDYIRKSKHFKHVYKLFCVGVDFQNSKTDLPISPYFLGIWLGDGSKHILENGKLATISISKPDIEIYQACVEEANKFGCIVRNKKYRDTECPTYRIVKTKPRSQKSKEKHNLLLETLRNVMENNYDNIPKTYLTASRKDRLSLLAGLLDTDGYLNDSGTYYEIAQKKKGYAEDIAFLARSLGYKVVSKEKIVNGTTYYRLTIAGDVWKIPLRISRKKSTCKKKQKNPTYTGFSVELSYWGKYFGFTLDGDGRFLLGDFTVTHNTEIAIAFAYSIPHNTLFMANEISLLYQAKSRWEKRTGEKAGIIGDGKFEIEKFTVASFDTLYSHRKNLDLHAYLNSVGCIFVDETQIAAAKTYWTMIMAIPAYYRYGLSATPYGRSDGMDPYVCAAIGPIIHEVNIKDLYDIRLVPPKVIFYNYPRMKDDFDCFGNWIKLIKHDRDRAKAMLELYRIVPKPCLVFFEWKDHGLNLFKMAEKAGFKAQIISGDHSADQRKKAIKSLNSGVIEILFASRIFSKGVDIPEIRSCINAAGMKAAIPAMQKLGRGLRLVEGKESLIYLDFVDTAYPVNQKHSRMRFATYKKEGLEVFKCSSIAEILTIMESNTGNGERPSLPGKVISQSLMNVQSSGPIIRGKLVEITTPESMRDLFFHLRYTDY